MKKQLIVIMSVWAALLFPARADSVADPFPWMTTSEERDYLFKMVPAKGRWDDEMEKFILEREAFGVAYNITEDGEFREIWRAEGWYTFEGYLSQDGRYFVRFGPWASDQRKHTDLAVAFYDNGKLLKQHAVRELIKKTERLSYSVSHYDWRAVSPAEQAGFGVKSYRFLTIDNTAYTFDFSTGKIWQREEDESQNSESRTEENQRGTKLFKASSFQEKYLPHFKFRDHTFFVDVYQRCSLHGSGWFTRLIPNEQFMETVQAETVWVEAIFQEKEGECVEVSLAPSEILSAIEKALRHPFISRQFSDGAASGLRLRILGDRLHWDTGEVADFLHKITGKQFKEDELKHWAYLIIDSDEEPRFASIYFNTRTGEIIKEDDPKWPWEPFLLERFRFR